jgi:hypothetical protein
MRRQAYKARAGPRAIAITDGGSRCFQGYAACGWLHDQTTERLNTKVTKFIIRQRRQARSILKIAHDADGTHTGGSRLANRIKGIDGTAGKMRRAMDVAINCTL